MMFKPFRTKTLFQQTVAAVGAVLATGALYVVADQVTDRDLSADGSTMARVQLDTVVISAARPVAVSAGASAAATAASTAVR